LLARRRKLGLSREIAARKMATSEQAVSRWERGGSPPASSYPGIIAFLGREPWREPTSRREQLIAARRRQGLTAEEAAARLGVDPSTYWRWESGRRPHRLSDRAGCDEFMATPGNCSIPPPDDHPTQSSAFDPGAALRERRMELGLSQKVAGATIGASAWTVMNWELGRTMPGDRFYPSLIRFLGREPWPDPVTIAERLRVERLRRGLTCAQAAVVLQVDEASIAAWERGEGPHHGAAKAKVDAFLTGGVRPWKRRKPKG
jgi:transcriptional regulator with XRE-family HTH domain